MVFLYLFCSRYCFNEQIIIKPGNAITSSVAQEFKEELQTLIDGGVRRLAIDMAEVLMIDSIGLGILINAHNSLSDLGGRLCVSNVSPDILNLFKTMRLDRHFEVIANE